MNMTRIRRLGCLLAAAAIFLQLAAAGAVTFPYTAYATDAVRLRERPSSSADVLAVIRKGDAVLVTGTDGNYAIVDYEGKRGYVVSSFIATGSETPQAPDGDAAPQPGRFLHLVSGSEGVQVKALQEALRELGFYTKAIDSKFGSGTELAVRNFQQANGLSVTGTANEATQELLFEGTPKNARGVKTDVKTLPPIPGVTMRPGDRGDAVTQLQQKLKDLGYFSGTADGEYGSGTETAVRAFQRDNRLGVDGVAGENTLAALSRAVPASQTPAQTAAPATPPPAATPTEQPAATYPYQTTAAASVNLRKRASVSAMRMITIPQGATLTVLEDGEKWLKVTYRSYTGYALKDYINIPEQYLSGRSLAVNTDARVRYETLTAGSEGRKVRALQMALSELGFYNGSVDGKYGAGTTAAVKAFQKQNGLRETGSALPELQQLLYERRVRNSRNRLASVKTLPPVEGLTLSLGDYGDAILELHQMLQAAGHFDGTPGYEFTRATATAVRAFQKAHSIRETGKVDSFTMLALKTNTAPQATPAPDSAQPTPLTAQNVIVIRSGTRGLAVTNLQARLVELGYYSVTPDGLYNSDDIAAVRQFQRVNSLTVSGVADLATQQTLYAAYALRADAQQSETTPAPQGTAGVLRLGSSGDTVRALQTRLVTLNYLTGTADGIFGTQTAAAVSAFQRNNSLTADGVAGSQTLGLVYSANAKANTPAATATAPPPEQQTALKIGDSGSAVTAMQQRLIALNYLTGSADGMFGPRTFLALQAFQEKNRLEADGVAGQLTLAKLNSATAIADSGVVLPPAPTTPPPPATFAAPRASEVRYANWYTEIRPIAQRLRNVVIYDFISGRHYNFRFYSLGKHADGDLPTKEDTATMNSVLGVNNWTPRPVWVIFSDGRVYMVSTHSHGHEADYVSGNDLTGHLCVHFPREMDEAAQTGPYAVSHQNAILAGWDLTQNMAR